MLYDRWRQIAHERGGQLALRDLASNREWTFSELARLAQSAPALQAPAIYPHGHSAEFILAVLQAWRDHTALSLFEPDQKSPPIPPPPPPCCHLKTPSATTGAVRAVAFTAGQLAADAENIVATMGLRPDWPNLGVISMAHSYGFSNLVTPLLLHGIPLIIVPLPLPEAIRRAAEAEPDVTLAGVPALWRAWHEAGAIPRNVRLAISAGAPLQAGLERAVFEATGLKIHNFYGASECGGICYDATTTPRTDDACVGAPMRNVDLTLNEDNCLQVRGRAVGQTYWPDSQETLRAGCFQTSDLADINGGLVYLRGRLSDQINVAGRKVSPATIERVLAEHAAVRECLVFGVPSQDAERTDLIVACVVSRGAKNAAKLKQFLLQRIPGWQVPREWWFVDSLAENDRGKVSRAEWRTRFLEKEKAQSRTGSIPNGA
jgi:acyl-CoA synthetase (AMP-forming)/AMP-acid ligase II